MQVKLNYTPARKHTDLKSQLRSGASFLSLSYITHLSFLHYYVSCFFSLNPHPTDSYCRPV